MLRQIGNLPGGAIGVEVTGRVSAFDRDRVFEPRIDAALATGHRVKLLYVAGPDFAGYDDGGLLDDTVFGTRHFTDFKKIAFVSDAGPYDRAVGALEGLIPAAVRRFPTEDIDRAMAWLAE